MLALAILLGSMMQAVQNGLQLFSSLVELVPIAVIFLIGMLLLPSTIYSFRRILGKEPVPFKISHRWGLTIFFFPPMLAAGGWAVANGPGWLALSALLLGTLLLVAWLLWIALRDLQPGSAQRAWGAFGSGLAATPALAFILEAIGLVAVILLLTVYVEVNPALADAVNALQNVSAENPDQLVQSLAPFFNDPFVLFSILISLSFFVPLIEELLKPLAVYLLMGRKLSEAQGFALGALSGAGYALVENLTLNTQPETLFLVAVARIGASAMHIFTAALSGYALVRAKNTKRILPLLGILALNITLHGLWNGMVLLSAASESGGGGPVVAAISSFAVPVMLSVTLGSLIFMYIMNRSMHRTPAGKIVTR